MAAPVPEQVCEFTGRTALKGVRECKVPGLGCGLHTAPGAESRLAGCGLLANSPLVKVRDGPATGGTSGDVTAGQVVGGGRGLGGELGCWEL